MTSIRDTALFLANFGLPGYLVARLGWRGVVAGAFSMWVLVYASGEIQRASDPQADRFGMGMWLVVGLPFTFIYCGITYGIRQFILFALARWGGLNITQMKYKS
jgi:hypothetical protein